MKKRIYFHIIIIFLLSLFPLLWFPDGSLLFGHDSGMTFDPVTHFVDRLHVWTERLGIGTDQSSGLLGAIVFIHGLEAFLAWIGLSLQMDQKIQFIIWFVLPGLSMYFFAHKTWPGRKYLPLIASVVYMINFFLIQAWFVAERTKFSIYVALPLIMYFTLSYLEGKTSFKKSLVATGLTLGFFNAGGSFPLYGGLILVMVITFAYQNFLHFDLEMVKKTIFFSLGLLLLYILLSAFWLFPYVYYVLGFYGRDLALAGGPAGSLAWSEYLAKGSTFINLFRGQGIPEWYLNAYHAFAGNFFTNPILILGSFAFPILAYFSLFLVKVKREKFLIYLFVVISLVSLIFAAGPGSQLGIIYEFMVLHVPGFAIFRSNFYKFGYAFWFSYGILIGFTLDVLFSKIENFVKNRKLSIPISYILPILFIVGYVFYHYPLLNGSFLDYSHEPGKELSTRVKVPQYVFDFGKWVNQQNPIKRYLILPEVSETGYIAYQWGYWSLAPINSLQAKNSFVHNTFLMTPSERFLLLQMYSSLLRKDIKSFDDFAEVFAVDGIVVHEDFDWQNFSWGTTDPARYEAVLDADPNFKLTKTFGRWRVYDIVSRGKSLRVTATSRLGFLNGELKNVASFPYFDPRSPLFMADLDHKNSDYFIHEATDVFLGPECIDCKLRGLGPGFNYYNPIILPGSFLYPLITYREEQVKKKANDFNSLLNYYLTVSDRRIVEGKWMIDSKQKLEHLQEVFDKYLQFLRQLESFVDKENWDVRGKEENTAALTISAHLLQQANFVESIYDNQLLNIDHRSTLAKAYETVVKLEKLTQNRLWITKDTIEKKYIFDLPEIDAYDVYVKKGSLANPVENTIDVAITFQGDSSTKLKPIDQVSDWLYFGQIKPTDNKLRLALTDTTVKNLLDGIKPIMSSDTTGINVEKDVYSLTTDSRDKCFSFDIKNLDASESQYQVKFRYRNLTDRKDLGFYVSQPNEAAPKIRIKETFLTNSREWFEYSQPILTKNDKFSIVFCNGFSTLKEVYGQEEQKKDQTILPGQTVIQIQGISVNKVSFPNIVLYKNRKNADNKEYTVDFKKINPVEYTIQTLPTNNPVTLVMREGYGKYWQVCQKNGECLSFDDKAHFASAGFTNGWYFKNGISDKITLYYFPQKMYEIGAYISVGTLMALIGGILWYKLRKK